jgi:cyclophilin family peptidyl-prolyl cis-trans isomerase
MAIDTAKTYTATVKTDVGTFVITLDAKNTPITVNNFVFLAQNHFYDCVTFHRVIPTFMDQTGDPTGTGTGGPGYEFADELPKVASPQYPIGSVAMANAGPNTNGSQFFIVTGPEGEDLPPSYTLFGQVTSGIGVADKINMDGNANPSASGVPPKVIHRILSIAISSQ